MPIYEYRCEKCGDVFEELVSGGKEPENCPGCGSRKLKKLFSVFGFRSPGGGDGGGSSSACSSCTADTCSSCDL